MCLVPAGKGIQMWEHIYVREKADYSRRRLSDNSEMEGAVVELGIGFVEYDMPFAAKPRPALQRRLHGRPSALGDVREDDLSVAHTGRSSDLLKLFPRSGDNIICHAHADSFQIGAGIRIGTAGPVQGRLSHTVESREDGTHMGSKHTWKFHQPVVGKPISGAVWNTSRASYRRKGGMHAQQQHSALGTRTPSQHALRAGGEVHSQQYKCYASE